MADARRILNTLVSKAVDGSLEATLAGKKKHWAMGVVREAKDFERVSAGTALAGLGLLGVAWVQQKRKAQKAPVAPVPEPEPEPPSQRDAEAMLLVRAMIAAANADFIIEEAEKRAILDACAEMGLSPDDRRALAAEFAMPMSLDMILADVSTPEQARQVYAASLMVMSAGGNLEAGYLQDLADRLGLARKDVAALRDQLGLS